MLDFGCYCISLIYIYIYNVFINVNDPEILLESKSWVKIDGIRQNR